MPVIKSPSSKSKKLDLSKYFNGEDAYVTLKFIDRDTWKYINRLTMTSPEVEIYKQYISKNKDKEVDSNKVVDILQSTYKKLSKEEIDRLSELEIKRNKLLISHGLDENEHNLYDETGKKVILNYDTISQCEFFDHVLVEIINFNSSFDLSV